MTAENHPALLVELGCEELPPKTLANLARSFFESTCKGLEDSGLDFDRESSRYFYTPRRLAFRLASVPSRQPDQVLERKGPAVSAAFDDDGNPTRAATGFAASVGKSVEELERLETDKGAWLYCKVEQPGKALSDVLFPVLEKALSGLPVAKPMRWSDHEFSFVRPVHWLVVLHGQDVVNGKLLGLSSGKQTRGHRIHNPGPHEVSSSENYESLLKEAFVLVDQDERREIIREQAKRAGTDAGGVTRITESLLEEVSNILEWPVPVVSSFETAFLDVPQEALVASMEDHQKFFPVLDGAEGHLTERFVVFANLQSKDVDTVSKGFERVIRPRLADAAFFWEQDRKAGLESHRNGLDRVVFQKKLGSVGDKSRRIEALSKELAEEISLDSRHVERAAQLCKCDLLTHMVGEFPELQGVMGGYYAHTDGEDQAVSKAIAQHYLPGHAEDVIPETDEGAVLSVADKMDTLVGIFAAGLKPTGNKDPFALRRSSLGIARILMEKQYPITVDGLFGITASCLKESIEIPEEVVVDARQFFTERLRNYFRDRGTRTSVVNAVFAAPITTVSDLADRVEAVSDFLGLEEAETLVAANKRIGNILRTAEFDFDSFSEKLLVLEEEIALFDEINDKKSIFDSLIEAGNYGDALAELAGLHGTVERFFDNVLVMDEDDAVRNNRLALLAQLKGLFDRVADFAQAG